MNFPLTTRFATGMLLLFFCIIIFPNSARAALLSTSEQAWMEEHSQNITFAPIGDYPPFLWSQYGVLFGISSDYVNYIQEKLSTEFKSKEPRTRKEILEALQSGEVSFASSLTETPERLQYLLFTRPYVSMPVIFVAKSGLKNRTSSEIIDKGLKVSVSGEYSIHAYLSERYPKMNLVPVDNNYKVLQNILTGVTEVGVINVASLAYLTDEHNLENLKKIGDTGFSIRLAFAIPKSIPELRDIFDKIIETMPPQTRDAILSRWITDTVTIDNLAGSSGELTEARSNNNETAYLVFITAFLMLCLGFILHYFFVRSTPRKDVAGNTEYIP